MGERESCVSREPDFSGGGAGYELFDLVHKEVWLTLDFTAQEYAEFSPPFLWVKNDPRIGMADGGEFLRSPGCSEPGQFTYMQAFDKEKLIPIDAVVVGIVDNLEMAGRAAGKKK